MLLHICFAHIWYVTYIIYIYVTHVSYSYVLLGICCPHIYILIVNMYMYNIHTQNMYSYIYIHLNILPRTWWDNILCLRLQVEVNKWVCLNMCCTSQNKTGCLFADQSYDIETFYHSFDGCFGDHVHLSSLEVWLISWSLWNQLRWWLQREFSLQGGHLDS